MTVHRKKSVTTVWTIAPSLDIVEIEGSSGLKLCRTEDDKFTHAYFELSASEVSELLFWLQMHRRA